MGIDSDVLYPLREQEELARYMPNAELKIIHSDAGHDGFLLEQDQVAAKEEGLPDPEASDRAGGHHSPR